jgi:hypothetical protein
MDFDQAVRLRVNIRQAHPSAREHKRMNLAFVNDGKAHIAGFANVRRRLNDMPFHDFMRAQDKKPRFDLAQ